MKRRRPGHRQRMVKLWINPVVVGVVGLLGLAIVPVRTVATSIGTNRSRRDADTARLAQERAYAAWAFDEDHQVWIPGVLRR